MNKIEAYWLTEKHEYTSLIAVESYYAVFCENIVCFMNLFIEVSFFGNEKLKQI